MIKKLYIGIDPDLRLLNAAIVTDQKQALAVFKRLNKGLSGDKAVAQAVQLAEYLMGDMSTCMEAYKDHIDITCEVILIVESQNMEHARAMRKKGRKINYQNILQLGQVAGIIMGALSSIVDTTVLVQAIEWKGSVPKNINQNRTYKALGIVPDLEKKLKNIYPKNMDSLSYYSHDKINPSDFMDINDSLGLALYGAKKKL
jgi:hypothetical protein